MACGYNTDLAWEALLLRMMNTANAQFMGMFGPELLFQFAAVLLRCVAVYGA